MTTGPGSKLALGIAGFGHAGAALVPFVAGRHDVDLVAVADPSPAQRARVPRGVEAFESIEEMIASDRVAAVYVATPTEWHARHATTAARHGKHVVVEKPMATSLEDAESMVAAAEAAGTALVVGHSHSFEAPVRAMRGLVESGRLGRLYAINAWNFTDWLFRPRAPEELDPRMGGGVVFRQGAHHADIARYLAGGRALSVRAQVGTYPAVGHSEGSYQAFVQFEGDVAATLVYSGHDHFSTGDFTFGLGENGTLLPDGYATARRSRGQVRPGDGSAPDRQEQLLRPGGLPPTFGLVLMSCEHGDVRVGREGLLVYGDNEVSTVSLDGWPRGRDVVLDELVAASKGEPVAHDGRWGLANLEVVVAMRRSSAEHREIELTRQVGLPTVAVARVRPEG